MNAAGGCVGQRVGDAAAVTDDKEAGIAGLQTVVDLHFHIVELHFHAVQQGIVIAVPGATLSSA